MKENRSKGYHFSFDWHQIDIIKWSKTVLSPGYITNRQMMFISYGLDRNLILIGLEN